MTSSTKSTARPKRSKSPPEPDGVAKPPRRCGWGEGQDDLRRYHDEEWGVPLHDERGLFEFLVLEGAQAGLSWVTILKKRDAYRRAFDDFDPVRVARYGPAEVRRLLGDAGIVRNRLKIESAISNAKAFLGVQAEHGSFDRYIWSFVDGQPIQNRWRALAEIPAHTELSDRISRELRVRGFRFVGSTIVYAHLQATGMVNDHLVSCFRWREVQGRKGR
jgi:DNA-3-methyladenine glycosylase I